jgi:hypothetical protein
MDKKVALRKSVLSAREQSPSKQSFVVNAETRSD